MQKCPKNLSPGSEDSQDILKKLETFLNNVDEQLPQATQIAKIRQHIREEYLNSQTEEITDDDLANFGNLVAQAMENCYYPYTIDVSPETLKQIKSGEFQQKDPIDSDKTTQHLENASKGAFQKYDKKWLTFAYGTASNAYNRAYLASKLGAVSAALVNRGYLTEVQASTITRNTLNTNIRAYQEQLYKQLYEYLSKYASDEYFNNNFKTLYGDINPLTGTRFVVTDASGLNALEYIQTYLERDFLKFTDEQLQNNTIIAETSPEQNPTGVIQLDAYQAYVFLTNFDSLLRTHFGESIIIKPGLFNELSIEDKYIMAEKTDDSYTFNDNEEIYVEEAVSKIVQNLVETTPYYAGKQKTSSYLQFGQFNAVIANLKDLVYNSTCANTTISSLQLDLSEDTRDYLNYIAKDLYGISYENLTLRDLISSLTHNPIECFPAIIEIFAQDTLWQNSKIASDQRVADIAIRDTLYSIYKGITGLDKESLRSISPKHSLADINYFAYITQSVASIFKNKFGQCVYDQATDSFKLRSLADQSLAQIERKLEDAINVRNNPRLTTTSFINTNFDIRNPNSSTYEFVQKNSLKSFVWYVPMQQNYTQRVLRVTIPINATDINQSRAQVDIADFPQNPSTDDVRTMNNLKWNSLEAESYLDKDAVGRLLGVDANVPGIIEDVLNLNMFNNPQYYNAFLQRYPNQANTAAQHLLILAGHILANKYVVQEAINEARQQWAENKTNPQSDTKFNVLDLTRGLSVDTLKSRISAAFGTTLAPDVDPANGQVALINTKTQSGTIAAMALGRIAYAKGIAEGIGRSSQTKDNDGNGLGNYTLSRLIGNVTSQMDMQCRKSDSATKGLSIVNTPEVLKGFVKLQEVVVNGVAKKTTQMNLAEMTYASFITEFMQGFLNVSDTRALVGNAETEQVHGFLASVNSDKAFIDYMLVNVSAAIKSERPELKGKSIKDLLNDPSNGTEYIKMLIADEIGQVYKTVLENIQEDYNVLENYIQVIKDTGYLEGSLEEQFVNFLNWKQNNAIATNLFDYETNFSNIKTYFASLGVDAEHVNSRAEQFIKSLCLHYNTRHPAKPVELVDQLHMNKGLEANGTLLNLVKRFDSDNLGAQKDFWEIKESEVLTQLLNDGFKYVASDQIIDNSVDKLFDSKKMLNAQTGSLILGTIQYQIQINGDWVKYTQNITSKNDLLELEHYLKDNNVNVINPITGEIINLNEADSLLNPETLRNFVTIQLNEYLQKYNLLDYYFTQQHLLTSVGSHIAHPDKSGVPASVYLEHILAQEASRFFAQHKRNVSETASMHEFQNGMLNGIPNLYNVACIDDIKDSLFNLIGDTATAKPYDGATWVNPIIVRLENWSLGAEKAGNSKKQFVHFYNHRNANGGIIKTCGFGITNLLAMNPRMANCLKKMMNRTWFDNNGRFFTKNGSSEDGSHQLNMAVNGFGENITTPENQLYKDIYYFNPLFNKFYKRTFITTPSLQIDGQQVAPMQFDSNTGLYTFFDQECVTELVNGKYVSTGKTTDQFVQVLTSNEGSFYKTTSDIQYIDANGNTITDPLSLSAINNNWSAYQELFKGQYCYDLVPNRDGTEDGYLHYSETSLDNLATMVNNMGYQINPLQTTSTQRNYWQPAKYSDIHYLVTSGAIKQGAANMNSADCYDNDTPLNFQRINTNQIGIQLDKEHHADGEDLSIMNQVIQACQNRGFTAHIATEMCEALANRVEAGIRDQLDTFKSFLKSSGTQEDFLQSIRAILLKAILNSGPKDGNLVVNIAKNIMEQLKEHPELTPVDVQTNIPFSDSALFSKLNSIIGAFINRNGIRTKLDGVLSVLNPSVGITKIHNGHAINYYQPDNIITVGSTSFENELVTGDTNSYILEAVTTLFNGEVHPKALIADQLNAQNIASSKDKYAFKERVFINGTYLVHKSNSETAQDGWEKKTVKTVKDINDLQNDSTIDAIFENYIDGRDLAHYHVTFTDTENNVYNIYDLQSSKLLFALKERSKELKKLKALSYNDLVNQIRTNNDIRNFIGDFIDKFYSDYHHLVGYLEHDLYGLSNYRIVLDDSNEHTITEILNSSEPVDDLTKKASYQSSYAFLCNEIIHRQLPAIETLLRRQLQSDLGALSPQLEENQKFTKLYEALKELEEESYDNQINAIMNCDAESPLNYVKRNWLSEQELLDKNSQLADLKHNLEGIYWQLGQGISGPAIEAEQKQCLEAISKLEKDIAQGKFDIGLEMFNALQASNSKFLVNGEFKTINKNSVKTRAYEVIMPKKFKSTFGLSKFTDLQTIKNDPNYFVNRLLNQLNDQTPYYSLALKSINGKHTYILTRDDFNKIKNDGKLIRKNIFTNPIRTSNYIQRIDAENNSLGKLHYTIDEAGQYVDDQVYTDGSVEIIVTDDLDFYRDNYHYSFLKLNESFEGAEDFMKNCQFSTNDVARALYEDWVGQGATVMDSITKSINRIGHALHTSFLKTLQLVAARIPAQSQQSFMPMEVVAFDDVDVNSAYVSDAQIWLQGSDYDVDAVSLALNSVTKSGMYASWSKYANLQNMDLLNASCNMPFPKGKLVELQSSDVEQTVQKELNKKAPKDETAKNKFIEDYTDSLTQYELKRVNGYVQQLINLISGNIEGLKLVRKNRFSRLQMRVNNNTVEQINGIAKFIRTCNTIGMYELSNRNIPLIDQLHELCKSQNITVAEMLNTVVSFINDYNTFLETKTDDYAILAANNGIVHGMYQTSIAPVNRLESETSVDATTGPFKEKAEESELSKELKTYTPGNFVNKIKAIIANQVGKVSIGICAVGTKTMAAWTAYCNYLLNYGNPIEQKNMVANKYFAGLEYKFKPALTTGLNKWTNLRKLGVLANVRSMDPDTIGNQYVKSYVDSLDQDTDAVISLSALLSLATDNAKELCLSPLNATPNTLGMYVYGLSVGIPFNEVSRLMMSPLGRTISTLMEGNAFTKTSGATSVSAALDQLTIGPTALLRNYDSEFKNELFERLKKIAQYADGSKDHDIVKKAFDICQAQFNTTNTKTLTATDLYDILGRFANIQLIGDQRVTVWDKIKVLKKIQLQPNTNKQLHRLLQDLKEYLHQVDTIKYKTYSTGQLVIRNDRLVPEDLFKIEALAQGASEMKTLGSILAINNGVKTKFDESMTFMRKLSNITLNRQQEVTRVNQRSYYLLADRTKDERPLPTLMKNVINVTEFMTNDDYRLGKIREYENIKHTVNILDVISKVSHFKAYLGAAVMEYAGRKAASSKVRAAEVLGDIIINDLNANSSKDIGKIYKAMNDFVSDFVRRTWLKERHPDWKVPIKQGQQYFEKGFVVTADKDKFIPLSTEDGEATLKLWMESFVIPNLRHGLEMSGSPKVLFSNIDTNKFIKGLTAVVTDRTPIHVLTGAYSLFINMSPRDEGARVLLNQYRTEFNKLIATDLGGKSIKEWFWIYNQIVFQGKPGERTLTSIFDDFNAQSKIVQDFYNFESEFDATRDIIYGIDVNLRDLRNWCVPVQGMYSSHLNAIYTDNPEYLNKTLFVPNRDYQASAEQEGLDDQSMEGFDESRYAERRRPYRPDSIPPRYAEYYIRGHYESKSPEVDKNSVFTRRLGSKYGFDVEVSLLNGYLDSIKVTGKTFSNNSLEMAASHLEKYLLHKEYQQSFRQKYKNSKTLDEVKNDFIEVYSNMCKHINDYSSKTFQEIVAEKEEGVSKENAEVVNAELSVDQVDQLKEALQILEDDYNTYESTVENTKINNDDAQGKILKFIEDELNKVFSSNQRIPIKRIMRGGTNVPVLDYSEIQMVTDGIIDEYLNCFV